MTNTMKRHAIPAHTTSPAIPDRWHSILPGTPLYGFFSLPRGRLLKVHAEACMYAPGYLQSNKPRWNA